MNRLEICKNCNYKLDKQYCSNCGQKNVEVLELKIIIKDFFKDVFELDSRVFLTLKYLLFKPGFLTKEYWLGKRKRYISPMRLIIITSFIYFIMVPFLFDESETFFYKDDQPTANQKKVYLEAIDARLKTMVISLEKYATLIATPFLTFILSWLYRNRGLLYLHHIIVWLHFCSFEYCLHTVSSAFMLLFETYSDLIDIISIIPLIIYLIIMMKNLYEDSYAKTIVKAFIVLSSFILFAISVLVGYVFIPTLFLI